MYGSEAPEADSGGPGGGSGDTGAGSDVGPQGPSATWGLATAGLTRPDKSHTKTNLSAFKATVQSYGPLGPPTTELGTHRK